MRTIHLILTVACLVCIGIGPGKDIAHPSGLPEPTIEVKADKLKYILSLMDKTKEGDEITIEGTKIDDNFSCLNGKTKNHLPIERKSTEAWTR